MNRDFHFAINSAFAAERAYHKLCSNFRKDWTMGKLTKTEYLDKRDSIDNAFNTRIKTISKAFDVDPRDMGYRIY